MGTLRHDRISLWGDPRISEAQIVESIESAESLETNQPGDADVRSRHTRAKGRRVPSRAMTILGFAGASMVAAAASRWLGLGRVARLLAYVAPSLLLLALYEERGGART
ncbi:MAG: hypothetical protein NVS3B10_23850 [Polyangiales bacterium]